MSRDDDVADPVGLLAEEFVARYRRGERPALTEYTAKHPELAERIRQVFPMMVMMEQAGSDSESLTDAPRSDTVVRKLEQIAGYRILREIGRGGMGVVYEAEQVALGRRVALKILPQQVTPSEGALARFRREAQAAARLHHTNIVPVFEVGDHAGVHFYAMQYIEGQTLDDVLSEVRRLRAGEADTLSPSSPATAGSLASGLLSATFHLREQAPVEKPLEKSKELAAPGSHLPALSGEAASNRSKRQYHRGVAELGIQVAEALDYAHKQGILHRDIKPSNLLLDVRGTVWVTDFGLAKTEGCDNLTGQGDLLGTLRYMAPERFDGQADPRSDLYSLGLTLYEMIALRPAFDATSQAGVVERILSDEPPRLRGIDSSVPRDLETIIAKAIRKEPGRRYQSAAELAEDLRRFLEDRPILARRTGLVERGWRWCRRHPSKAALAGTVAATAILIVAAGWWYTQQQAVHAQWARDRLTQAALLRDQGQWSEARAIVELLLQSEDGNVDVSHTTEELLADLRMLERVAEIRASKEDHRAAKAIDAEYAGAFREYGIDVKELEVEEAARLIRARPAAVGRDLVAALDDWALERSAKSESDWRRLITLAGAADNDPWRKQLRERAADRDLNGLRKLVAEADIGALSVQSLHLMGLALAKAGDNAAAVAWFRAAQRRHPGDIWINYELGQRLEHSRPPRRSEAVGFYRASAALRPELGHRLAHALLDQGDHAEAAAIFRELARARPHDAMHHNCLAWALVQIDDKADALAAVDQALVVGPDLAIAWATRAHVLWTLERHAEALVDAERAIQLNPQYARAHVVRGMALAGLGKPAEGLVSFDRAAVLDPKLGSAHSWRAIVLVTLGESEQAMRALDRASAVDPYDSGVLANRASVLWRLKRPMEALAAADQAITLNRNHLGAHKSRANLLFELERFPELLKAGDTILAINPRSPVGHFWRGWALHRSAKSQDALESYSQAITLDPRYAEAYVNRGLVLEKLKRVPEGLADYDQALVINPKLPEAHYNRAALLRGLGRLEEALAGYDRFLELKPEHAMTHAERGQVLHKLGRSPEAVAAYDRAIKLKPDLAAAHFERGDILFKMKKWPEALDSYDQGLRHNPNDAVTHTHRGRVLLFGLRKPTEALAAFDRALTIEPDRVEAHFGRGLALSHLGRPDEAELAYRQVIARKADDAQAHCNLGLVLRDLGRFSEALAALRRGDELGSKLANWNYDSAGWVRHCQRLVDLDARLPAVLRGEDKPGPEELTEFGRLCRNYKHLHAAAAQLYEQAFEAQPELAENLSAGHRYHAACSAAVAGCGQSRDAEQLDEQARARWRKHALTWLRMHLDSWTRHFEKGTPQTRAATQRDMELWQREKQLAGLRDPAELTKLPPEEQAPLKQFWADVAALHQRAVGRK